jgi:hypothetical protein
VEVKGRKETGGQRKYRGLGKYLRENALKRCGWGCAGQQGVPAGALQQAQQRPQSGTAASPQAPTPSAAGTPGAVCTSQKNIKNKNKNKRMSWMAHGNVFSLFALFQISM